MSGVASLSAITPEWVVAAATAVLAFVAFVSIFANLFLGVYTKRAAAAAVTQAGLEREQLDLQKRQLDAAAAAARPLLSVKADGVGDRFVNGYVSYDHGSEPAYEVEVWIRTRAHLTHASIDRITLMDRSLDFMATEELDFSRPGIPELAVMDAVQGADLLMVATWKRGDGTPDRWGPRLVKVKPGQMPSLIG